MPANFAGGTADEVLFHELIHAKRTLEGRMNQQPLHAANEEFFHSFEEFVAVVATDIYMSNKGAISLRGGHTLPSARDQGVFQSITPHSLVDSSRLSAMFGQNAPMQESIEFARLHRVNLQRFVTSEPSFATRLAREAATVRFNPLRDLASVAPPPHS
jgi:hypothetical protein